MSALLANLLADPNSGALYRRLDVQVMDSSSTSLPAESLSALVVDGVTLAKGDRVLYTALSSGANKVYVVALDPSSIPEKYVMQLALDSRSPNGDGSPVAHDAMRVLEGSHAQKLMVWDGSAWEAIAPVDSADSLALISLGDFATGGSIGSAASTVDKAQVIAIAQTTAAQTLTLPSPTAAATIRSLEVLNTGSASFTMLSQTVAAGTGLRAMWSGSAWIYIA